MLPPFALVNKVRPYEVEIERSYKLLADLRQTSLMELALDRVELVLSALNTLLHSHLGSAQLLTVRASLMRRVKALLPDFKLARYRSSEHDLAEERWTSLTQSLSPSLVQYRFETHEYSLCYTELDEAKEQLEVLRRKVS